MSDYTSQFSGPEIDARLAKVPQLESGKQDILVSGTNIKTINGQSILGAGNISVQGGDTNAVKYVAQTLTEEQKAQARANIDAASLADINDMDFVDATTLPTASASTMGHIYLIGPDANDNYDRYFTQESGGTYSWVSLGSTQIDLSTYATKAEVGDISDLQTQDKSNVVAAINEVAARHGFPTDAAELLVSILRRAVYTTDDVKADIDALEEEIVIYNLASITAVFTPGDKTFYVGESVEDLRPYLVVKAVYEDETEETINGYTINGAFVEGVNTISITYKGKSTTISVTAEDAVYFRDTFANKVQLSYKWATNTLHPATIDGVVYYFTRIAYTGQTTPNRRCSYYLFDLDLVAGKTYDFLFKIDGLSNDTIVSTGLQFHDAVLKAAGIANEYAASANYESHLTDSTWQELTLNNGYYTKRYTCPTGMVGVRPCLKLGSGDTTNWPDTAIVKEFIIKEVSNE